MPTEFLQSVQMARETTWATVVTDSVKSMLCTKFALMPVLDGVVFKDIRASFQPGVIAAVRKIEGKGVSSYVCSYEDVNYLLEGLYGVLSPGGAGPYTRNGVGPTTSLTPRLFTLYHGDSVGTYKMQGSIITDVTFRCASNKEMTADANWVGQRITTATLAALSDRTVSPIMGDQAGTVAIDAWGGTIGTTTLSLTAWAYELKLVNEVRLKPYLGLLYPGAYEVQSLKPEKNVLKLSLEFNATSKAYVDEFIVGTLHQRQIRISHDNTANYRMRWDFAGTLLKMSSLFDYDNGTAKVDLEYQGTYNATLGNFLKYYNTNQLSALP